ncbi:hypothetical protein FZC78_07395 [Rossellomorea vietnamensis]|uniref:Uncharacterized protein n=1 Tax=Rossellomorea vietnamensis TaxID=218284 RepID=A0A5D4NTZ4_9BACI|nr:hypothetical protein [Rossellomorea vietnamensis]TYS17677.1 hypothetical protein FZC78_07395 [Rossellomorea vietnamensis]
MKKGKIKLGKTTSLSTLNLTYTMRMVIVAFFMIDGGGGAVMGVFRKHCCYLILSSKNPPITRMKYGKPKKKRAALPRLALKLLVSGEKSGSWDFSESNYICENSLFIGKTE